MVVCGGGTAGMSACMLRAVWVVMVAGAVVGVEGTVAGPTVQELNASLVECERNHRVGSQATTAYPTCRFRFERDTSTTYYCRDKGCGIAKIAQDYSGSTGVDTCNEVAATDSPSNPMLDSRFVQENQAPQTIPCAREIFNSGGGGGGTECVTGDSWASTPINTNIHNFRYPDFECPQYQTMSCCATNARFGFSYDTPYVGNNAAIHNPFGRGWFEHNIRVQCGVQRRSASGNTCGDPSSDGWSVFEGTSACGVNGVTQSTTISTAGTLEAFSRASICERGHVISECSRLQSEWSGMGEETCSGEVGTMQRFDMSSKCSSYTSTYQSAADPGWDPSNDIPTVPMGVDDIAGCQDCHALFKAFHCFPCSGMQGDFVTGSSFRVCRSACDRLFNACGKPSHYGGKYVQSAWDTATSSFRADYNDSVSMCQAMWNPHADSVWAVHNISLEVVPDDDGKCVKFERQTFMLNYDTQNMIFDYGAIRNGDGYCMPEDPLYNPSGPCSDLQSQLDSATGTKTQKSARANGGAAMYSLDDVERGRQIANGWPWEGSDGWPAWAWAVLAVGIVGVVGVAVILVRRRKKGLSAIKTDGPQQQL